MLPGGEASVVSETIILFVFTLSPSCYFVVNFNNTQ